MRQYLSQLAADAKFYHRLKRPLRPVTAISVLVAACRSPGFWVLSAHRIIHWCYTHRERRTPAWWFVRLMTVPAQYVNNVVFKSDLLGDCDVAGPAYLPDSGYLTCGARSIGSGSMIHDHVTFGQGVGGGNTGRPRIGTNVWVGSNSIVAGEIELGDGATVLPGTYVSQTVPPRAVVGGNPGRIIRREFDNSVLRSTLDVVDRLPESTD